jgi:poly(A) polymerase
MTKYDSISIRSDSHASSVSFFSSQIMQGRSSWCRLFEPVKFFAKYRHLIVVTALCRREEDRLDWQGLVESKIRHLVTSLERISVIRLAHVYPKTYPARDPDL